MHGSIGELMAADPSFAIPGVVPSRREPVLPTEDPDPTFRRLIREVPTEPIRTRPGGVSLPLAQSDMQEKMQPALPPVRKAQADSRDFLDDYLASRGNVEPTLIADRSKRRPSIGSIPPGQRRYGRDSYAEEEYALYEGADPSIRLSRGEHPYVPDGAYIPGGSAYDEYMREGSLFPRHLGEIIQRGIQGIPFEVQKRIRSMSR
jgi:hypothetical protein